MASERRYQLDGSRLRKIFFAIQSGKRVGLKECICQRCRNAYDVWGREMEGDFDDIDVPSVVVKQDEESVAINGDRFD